MDLDVQMFIALMGTQCDLDQLAELTEETNILTRQDGVGTTPCPIILHLS